MSPVEFNRRVCVGTVSYISKHLDLQNARRRHTQYQTLLANTASYLRASKRLLTRCFRAVFPKLAFRSCFRLVSFRKQRVKQAALSRRQQKYFNTTVLQLSSEAEISLHLAVFSNWNLNEFMSRFSRSCWHPTLSARIIHVAGDARQITFSPDGRLILVKGDEICASYGPKKTITV